MTRDAGSRLPEESAAKVDSDFPSQFFDVESIVRNSFCDAVVFRRECPSTNDIALELARTQSRIPSLVITDCQTGGRGRGNNSWWAREGALTFSLLLNPNQFGIPNSDWPLISLATAIAVADSLDEFCPDVSVGLKWPNDVHLAGRKVCGILVEPVQGLADRMVIGVGVNVLNSLQTAPEEVRSLATSIVDETNDEYSPAEFLTAFLKTLEKRLITLGQNSLNLKERWSRQCVLTGKTISLESGDRIVSGLCRGIDDSGAILVESDENVQPWFGGVVRIKS